MDGKAALGGGVFTFYKDYNMSGRGEGRSRVGVLTYCCLPALYLTICTQAGCDRVI